MALKFSISCPILTPAPQPSPCLAPFSNTPSHRPPTEVRFSRWNNANAEKFNERQRAQKEIEDDIRRHRRFDAATKITSFDDFDATEAAQTENFKSFGTPSSPSRRSIPGKKSKYSKDPEKHPAFRQISKISNRQREESTERRAANVSIGEDGVSFVIDGAPFEFKYSYTETPKVKPLKLREPFVPFGPTTMPRPWTGRAPLPPSKKKLKEFDSFVLPPPNKKGVKPVQKPGPFLPGSGPRYVKTREEILGEPLTEEEVDELVKSCLRTKRQLNIGRDGLTHNMLDNIHAHWKRRRVCKIKCKGVCTVDMDNVCQQLEVKTGGKVIYRQGGVLYLFRGRNYNSKFRPRFPLMLWKPATPVYPRLIQRVPEGLTLEEATEMRKKGRTLMAICKLAKNGVYCNLVQHVREAFEECELVRIDCQGIKGSDYRKIGAKLKDLVPCVLISFEHEHILIWRGQNWKSSVSKPEISSETSVEGAAVNEDSINSVLEGQEVSVPCVQPLVTMDASPKIPVENVSVTSSQEMHIEQKEDVVSTTNDWAIASSDAILTAKETSDTTLDNKGRAENIDPVSEDMQSFCGSVTMQDGNKMADDESDAMRKTMSNGTVLALDAPAAAMSSGTDFTTTNPEHVTNQLESPVRGSLSCTPMQDASEASHLDNAARLSTPSAERILLLMKQAVDSGYAVVLDDASLDADSIYKRAVAFGQSAPPGPVFRCRPRKAIAQKSEEKSEQQEAERLESQEVATVPKKKGNRRQTSEARKTKDIDDKYLDVVPQGSLGVDELAKLLA